MKTWYFPYTPDRLHDATEYYVRTLELAGEALGVSLRRVDSIRAIPARADVLTIDCKTACRVIALRPGSRFWLWVQGVTPEEVELEYGSKLRKLLWTFRERVALPRARGVILVSEAMRAHYAAKYGYGDLRALVMPCVNKQLDPASFASEERYRSLRFVYAGSLHRWQCFDLTLQAFAHVRARRPDATLTVLTSEEALARSIVQRAGVEGVSVGRVPLAELDGVLRTHKYGFVLRLPHVVNAVATPTKVSSYMAAGVIPIITAAVHDYREKLGHLDTVLMTRSTEAAGIAEEILAFDARPISAARVLSDNRRVFEDYFDHDRYLPRLAEFLRGTGLGSP